MRILQVIESISPHQLPLARELAKNIGIDNFRLATTRPPMAERTKMGWDSEVPEPWILKAAEKSADKEELDYWWDVADVVLCSERQLEKIAMRIEKKKLTFYMSERWFKPPIGMFRLLYPRYAGMACCLSKMSKSPYFYYLPIGQYAARDLEQITDFSERIFNWGYFTEIESSLSCSHRLPQEEMNILWAGRMLSLKRVDTLIRAYALVRHSIGNIRLTLIGDGPARNSLIKLIRRYRLSDYITLLPSMPVSDVRKYMHSAHVYVLPSNGYEGWGAVLNEAMSEGCAVIASRKTGAASNLIEDGKNGLLFDAGDWKELARKIDKLYNDEQFRYGIASSGQNDIRLIWSPLVTADRFINVSKALLDNNSLIPNYESGPMSKYCR